MMIASFPSLCRIVKIAEACLYISTQTQYELSTCPTLVCRKFSSSVKSGLCRAGNDSFETSNWIATDDTKVYNFALLIDVNFEMVCYNTGFWPQSEVSEVKHAVPTEPIEDVWKRTILEYKYSKRVLAIIPKRYLVLIAAHHKIVDALDILETNQRTDPTDPTGLERFCDLLIYSVSSTEEVLKKFRSDVNYDPSAGLIGLSLLIEEVEDV